MLGKKNCLGMELEREMPLSNEKLTYYKNLLGYGFVVRSTSEIKNVLGKLTKEELKSICGNVQSKRIIEKYAH